MSGKVRCDNCLADTRMRTTVCTDPYDGFSTTFTMKFILPVDQACLERYEVGEIVKNV